MLKFLVRGQHAALWYVLLVFCLPIITLIGFGLIHLWQNQWLILVSISWLTVTLAGFAVYRLWPERRKPQKATEIPSAGDSATGADSALLADLPMRLEARADWTRRDHEVWRDSLGSIEEILTVKPAWDELPELALELLSSVSEQYGHLNSSATLESGGLHKKARKSADTYHFTLPEMLMVFSVTSSRYRQLLLGHVPFVEKIKISAILKLYAKQDQIITGAGWINTVRRTTRLVNPLAAAAAEIRDHFTDRIFTSLSNKVQDDLKRLLLQELVQVGMDLYSGRLKSTDEELSHYQSDTYVGDRLAAAEPVEPLRVVLLGQVSAGKSSLINAMLNALEAETDILPTTDKSTVHAFCLPSDSGAGNASSGSETKAADEAEKPFSADVHLIDTVGLVDNSGSINAALLAAKRADLLIWVTRSTQPARAPDAQLYQALMQVFAQDPALRPPPMLLVLSHIDQLSPKAEWDPPYDLNSDRRKAQTIKRAIESCAKQIGFSSQTPAIPVVLAPQHEPYNVDALVAQILLLRREAAQVQLNRRRLEREMNMGGWQDRWDQASKLGTVTGKLLTRSFFGD